METKFPTDKWGKKNSPETLYLKHDVQNYYLLFSSVPFRNYYKQSSNIFIYENTITL